MYTSGRTVKSRKAQPSSVVKAATADVRKIVAMLVDGAHIASTATADPITLAAQVRTVVTFPSPRDAETIADALESMSRIVRIITDPNGVTIIRTV